MILTVVCVHDKAAAAYLAPFSVGHIQLAVRAFADQCNTPNTDIGRHPEDFTLFKLGTYDDSTGRFDLLPSPEAVGNGVNYVRKEAKQ